MSTKADHPDSFFMSMRPVLWIGQIAGVFPLHGTTGSNYKFLRYAWYNWQILYVGVLFASSVYLNIISTKENLLVSDGIRLDNFGSTIFYSVCNLNTIFFVDLARRWPALSEKTFFVEKSMAGYGYPPFMAMKIKVFLGTFIILSASEHSLLTYLNILGANEAAIEMGRPFLERFFEFRFPVIMENVPYSDFIVIFVFLVTVICTLNWNYLDWFLSCLSIQMTSKLEQFNSRLAELAPLMVNNDAFWRKMCDDYNNLSLLTKEFERYVSKFVFMSYVSNLYHLSLQLLRSLRFRGDKYSMIYFYFSMLYLMLRTLTVSFCGARIHEESKKAKNILFEIKNTHVPCLDAERLLRQIVDDDICFTGKKFFSINRRFIVTLIGTVVTYEVILLQLNALRYEDTRI